MYRLSAWLSRTLPYTIVCNAHAARESHIAYGYGAQRMQVISNGFDGERFDPARHGRAEARGLHGFAPQHLVVGHLARFSVEKDHIGFLRAAQLAVAQCPALRFMLVGREVDERNGVLARAVRELGLGDHVRMFGERSDTERCLRAMDIFCLSSIHEGCPNVLGEAMCMALPCVATDAGDARVLAGSAASIVPRADPQALAEALVGVARLTPEQREQRGNAARQRMQEAFSMQRVCRQYEDTYRAAAAAAA